MFLDFFSYIFTENREDPQFYRFGESCLATDFTNHSEVKFGSVTPVRYTGENYEKFYSSFGFKVGEDACKEEGRNYHIQFKKKIP